MTEYLEVWSAEGGRLIALDREQITIGRLQGNDIALGDDSEVSRHHAVIERIGAMWCVRDLTSTNGTWVDGERIFGDRPLRLNCEVRVGRTRMIFRGGQAATQEALTAAPHDQPVVTKRERDVLLALFRFTSPGEMFYEPASTHEMSTTLMVSEAAIKQHLLHLYDKFHLIGSANRTRARLANEALRRGVVQMSELRSSSVTRAQHYRG